VSADAYFTRPRRELVAFVPGEAKVMLDVGCGGGAFAAGVRESRGGAAADLTIWGIELDPEAARRAEQEIDHVHRGDARLILQDLPPGHFDCVFLNDVLEHVADPETLLAGVRRVLAPAGSLIVSIPNVRYVFNVVDLAIKGRWDYTDEGILDRTHLRFYTRSSILGLLEQAGFRIVQTTGINQTRSWKFRVLNLLTAGRFADMGYLQFAVVARLQRPAVEPSAAE